MKRVAVTLICILFASPLASAQAPRFAPPPPCRASVPASASPLLAYWGSNQSRERRPRVAVFPLQPEIDDAARVHLATALPERIRSRFATEPRLTVASDGAVQRALLEARGNADSASAILRADYSITGRLLILGSRQEVEVELHRPGNRTPVWQASFRATTSMQAVEDAIVRGLSRAFGLASTPAKPAGWPEDQQAHDALLAGDAQLRSSSHAGADSALAMYDRAATLVPASPLIAARMATASAMILERGGEIPGYTGEDGPRRVLELAARAMAVDSASEPWTARAILARVVDPLRFSGALDAHLRAVATNPRDAAAEHEYGITLLRLGDLRGAETHFRRALSLEPGRASTLSLLAEMELRNDRFDSACVLSNASIAAWPYDPQPYATRALARLRLADARDAYSDAELVGRLTTGAWADALRVLVRLVAGDVDGARQQTQSLTAKWLAPGSLLNVRDAEYLAMVYLAVRDELRAIESLRRARPIGADLNAVLRSDRLSVLRSDTTVVRLLRESSGNGSGSR
jgi:tetratricopeptide (TPR) repeat protein